MTNSTGREFASDDVMSVTRATLSNFKRSTDLTDRESVKRARLRKRAECRVELELDEFWDNVPI